MESSRLLARLDWRTPGSGRSFARAAALVLCLFLLGSLPARASVFRLTDTSVNEAAPQINRVGQVAWAGYVGYQHAIYLWDGSSTRLITDNLIQEEQWQLSDTGQVVWAGSVAGQAQIFLWDGVNTRQLTDGTRGGVGLRINRAGQVVWAVYDGEDAEVYLWDGTAVRRLTDNNWNDDYPQISDSGQVLWIADRRSGGYELNLWENGTTRLLFQSPLAAIECQMNAAGQVVWSGAIGVHPEIYLWDGQRTRQITGNDLDDVHPRMNAAGQIVWETRSAAGSTLSLWEGAAVRQITAGPGSDYDPQINDRGHVAWRRSSPVEGCLYLWDGTVTRRLSTAIPDQSPYLLSESDRVVWAASDGTTRYVLMWTGTSTLQLFATSDLAPGLCINAAGQAAWVGWDGADREVYTYDPAGSHSLTLAPATITGGMEALGTIRLADRAPPGGVTLSLSSSDATAASVPPTITVPAGEYIVTFPVTGLSVPADTDIMITARRGGLARAAGLRVLPADWITFTLDKSRIASGTAANGTVTLRDPAPATGAEIALSVDHFVVTVPGNLFIPAGERTARCFFRAKDVSEPDTVRITVTYEGIPRSVSLRIDPMALASVTVAAPSVPSGEPVVGTVTLTGPAPEGGALVRLATSEPGVVSVPESVRVPVGATTATFSITTWRTAPTRSIRITASYADAEQQATLEVGATVFLSTTLSPDLVRGGAPSAGHVVLTAPAPEGGAQIMLTSDSPSLASVPASVTIPAGATAATFPVITSKVVTGGRVTIACSYGGATRSAWLWVIAPSVETLTLAANSVQGGASVTGTVRLTDPAVEDLTILLLSSVPDLAAVPASVVVPAGATTVTFLITTATAESPTEITISTHGSAGFAQSRLMVLPPAVRAVTLAPSHVAGGRTAEVTVTLYDPAPAGGAAIALAGDDPSLLTLPASVLVPAGETFATFTVTTARVEETRHVTVTAYYGGASRGVDLTVVPRAVVSVLLDPAAVVAGMPATGSVTISDPAPVGGAVVTLTSSVPQFVVVPESVMIPAGETTASFPVTTSLTWDTFPTVILAVYDGTTQSAVLSVRAPVSAIVFIEGDVLAGGEEATATVRLAAPAPEGGTVVALTSDNTAVLTLPASVSIAAGETTATVPVTTTTVTTPTTIYISAWHEGVGGSDELDVVPALFGGLTVEPAPVQSGTAATGTVTLKQPAPPGGLVVDLEVDPNGGVVHVPASVTLAAAATTATFPIETGVTTQPFTAVLWARARGLTRSVSFELLAGTWVSVRLDPGSVAGGGSVVGRITLTRPAPEGGMAITLASTVPAATVPASVTVPAGETTATFPVTTHAVAERTQLNIQASAGGVSSSDWLTVLPDDWVTLRFFPEQITGGATVLGQVFVHELMGIGGGSVALTSSDPALLRVPEQVVPDSGRLFPPFSVETATVSAPREVVVTVTYREFSRSMAVTLLPRSLVALSVFPGQITNGGFATGAITLSGPAPPGGSLVTLACSAPEAASVPATVRVEAGATTATFLVTAQPHAGPTTVVITATYAGEGQAGVLAASVAGSRSATLSIQPVRRITVFERATRRWLLRETSGTATAVQFGGPEDDPVPADYLGLRRAQIAVFRRTTQEWFIRTDTGRADRVQFGGPGDLPVPGDYFGLGRAQIAVYRPSTQEWFLRKDNGQAVVVPFGVPGDVPVPGDYLGLGRAQIAVFRPRTAEWLVRRDDGRTLRVQWGTAGDQPLAGDYFGLGRTQIAVFRPSTREWFLRKDNGEAVTISLGGPGDVAMPADYFGLGRLQIGVFRPGTAEWFIRTDLGTTLAVPWGRAGDRPLTAEFGLRP
jgi:hypothetical protein